MRFGITYCQNSDLLSRDSIECKMNIMTDYHFGFFEVVFTIIGIDSFWPGMLKKVAVSTTHTWDRRTICNILDGFVIVEVLVKWVGLNAQKLPDFRNHSTLLVQHDIRNLVIHKTIVMLAVKIMSGVFGSLLLTAQTSRHSYYMVQRQEKRYCNWPEVVYDLLQGLVVADCQPCRR